MRNSVCDTTSHFHLGPKWQSGGAHCSSNCSSESSGTSTSSNSLGSPPVGITCFSFLSFGEVKFVYSLPSIWNTTPTNHGLVSVHFGVPYWIWYSTILAIYSHFRILKTSENILKPLQTLILHGICYLLSICPKISGWLTLCFDGLAMLNRHFGLPTTLRFPGPGRLTRLAKADFGMSMATRSAAKRSCAWLDWAAFQQCGIRRMAEPSLQFRVRFSSGNHSVGLWFDDGSTMFNLDICTGISKATLDFGNVARIS